MSTYTQLDYHIVFSTKNRVRCLNKNKRPNLFRYIWGIIKNKKSHLYRIGGVEDHIHIFTDIHQTICVADFVKDIKISTSKWVKHPRIFGNFTNWQDGYGAFTVSRKEKDNLIEYIKNQEQHHHSLTFREEFKRLLLEAGIEFDEKYLL